MPVQAEQGRQACALLRNRHVTWESEPGLQVQENPPPPEVLHRDILGNLRPQRAGAGHRADQRLQPGNELLLPVPVLRQRRRAECQLVLRRGPLVGQVVVAADGPCPSVSVRALRPRVVPKRPQPPNRVAPRTRHPQAELVRTEILLDLQEDAIGALLQLHVEGVAVDPEPPVDIRASHPRTVQVKKKPVVAPQEDPCRLRLRTIEAGGGIGDDAPRRVEAGKVHDKPVPLHVRVPGGAGPRPRVGLTAQEILLQGLAGGQLSVLVERTAQQPGGDEARQAFDASQGHGVSLLGHALENTGRRPKRKASTS